MRRQKWSQRCFQNGLWLAAMNFQRRGPGSYEIYCLHVEQRHHGFK